NRPSSSASNNSKPYQAKLIEAFGFAVPDSLITTDADAVLAFRSHHRDVIYKSISGVRSIVARFTDGDKSRLADVMWCPTQFQEYVTGTDYRVHVIGDEVFACEVISEADDYRYASHSGMPVEIRRASLDSEVDRQCRMLAAGLGLSIAGIDLRRAPSGCWYCFEVNPSPGFSYYEHATGQPLALSVARLLMLGSARCYRRTSRERSCRRWARPRKKRAISRSTAISATVRVGPSTPNGRPCCASSSPRSLCSRRNRGGEDATSDHRDFSDGVFQSCGVGRRSGPGRKPILYNSRLPADERHRDSQSQDRL